MASPTYSVSALVLKRTKLGETDLIITFLAQDGSQIHAIAKGARKPSSPFAARLELFSCVRLLLSRGKNLDIVKESKLIEPYSFLRVSVSPFEAASPIVEFLEKTTMEDLAVPRLFDLTCKTLLCFKDANEDELLKFTATFLLKALAFMGLRPRFDACMICGAPLFNHNAYETMAFSSAEGGSICHDCLLRVPTLFYNSEIIQCAQFFLYSTLENIAEQPVSNVLSQEVLRIVSDLLNIHMSISLKSLRFLFAHPF